MEMVNLWEGKMAINRKDFIVKILRIITIALDNNWELEDIIKDIERVIETHRMINS